MNNCVIFFWLLLLGSFATSTKLPSSFKKCNRKRTDFGECLAQAVEDAVGQLTKSFREVGLNSLDPLEVPSMSVAPGSGPTNFQQNYKNMKITGFSKPKITKFDVNFDKKVVTLECTFPKIRMAFDYDFKGKILLLPFYGKGPGTFSIDNVKFFFTFNLEEYQKDGMNHFKIIDSKLVIDPELIRFQFDNLFDGDENLGKNINQVFNDNWKEVFGDVKPSYEAAFGSIFTAMFNNLLEKVSIAELFDE